MSTLYLGIENFVMLAFIIKLHGLKVSHGWNKNGFTELLQEEHKQ